MAYTDADVEELIARSKIYDVLTRYCRALDRCDVGLMKTVYWEDGVDEHGVFSGNAEEFSEFIIKAVEQWFDVDTHMIGNVHFEIEGDVAFTESYLLSYCSVPGNREAVEAVFGKRYADQVDWEKDLGKTHDFIMGGRYIDRMERRNGEWRIARRRVVMDWNRNGISRTILDEGIYAHLRPLGERGRTDAVYTERPAFRHRG